LKFSKYTFDISVKDNWWHIDHTKSNSKKHNIGGYTLVISQLDGTSNPYFSTQLLLLHFSWL